MELKINLWVVFLRVKVKENLLRDAQHFTLSETTARLLQEDADGRRFRVQADAQEGSKGAEEPQGKMREETKYSKNRKEPDDPRSHSLF